MNNNLKVNILLYALIFHLLTCKAQPDLSNASKDHEFYKSSKIYEIIPADSTFQKLELLCKVWGFLKYHHPEIVDGKYNGDYELFRVMPRILNSNFDAINVLLAVWIDGLGDIGEAVNHMLDSSIVKMYPDYNWINNLIKDSLSYKLKRIRNVKRKNSGYYVAFKESPSPVLKNENDYPEMHYDDVGYRILALFRYWNIIQYYYPYRYTFNCSWNNVLDEFILIFINSSNELEYHKAILSLITRISDTHTIFTSQALEEDFLKEDTYCLMK